MRDKGEVMTDEIRMNEVTMERDNEAGVQQL